MNPIKVEIGQYREMNKGSLKAFFSLVIYPQGQKILDCRYFVNGDQRWFAFPQKEVKYTDGKKTDYIPYVSYLDKEYLEQLKTSVLQALNDAKSQEQYGQAQNQRNSRKENPVQPQSCPSYGELPF